ncbi:MAG TPA: peptide chain release factor-like protein [Dehalococcoidia bacterium]|nr:peptide chain release factor-like protein [Dehalococcoidia bacterium]
MRPDLAADDAVLLADCDVDTYRASGPGGQKRNKTESAVRLRHRSSGLMVIAEESRSQAENRARALKRLRKTLALRLREPAPEGIPAAASACIDKRGRLNVGQRDARYVPAIAAALDVLYELKGRVSEAAAHLGLTTGNLSSFLTEDEDVFVESNRIRASFGLKPLRRD